MERSLDLWMEEYGKHYLPFSICLSHNVTGQQHWLAFISLIKICSLTTIINPAVLIRPLGYKGQKHNSKQFKQKRGINSHPIRRSGGDMAFRTTKPSIKVRRSLSLHPSSLLLSLYFPQTSPMSGVHGCPLLQIHISNAPKPEKKKEKRPSFLK